MKRKVVKDGILAGQNRGEVEDKRAEKMGALAQYGRDNAHGGPREQIDGFAQADYRCTRCRKVNQGPKQPAFAIALHCPHCHRMVLHERVRG